MLQLPAIQDLTASPFIAQAADGPAMAGQGTASGTPATGAEGQPAAAGGDFIFLLIVPLILVMIMMSIFGQRKEKKKREAMLGPIKKHDRVRTIGGVIGAVVEIKPDTIVLKVDESSNTRMTFTRDAVQQVMESSDEQS